MALNLRPLWARALKTAPVNVRPKAPRAASASRRVMALATILSFPCRRRPARSNTTRKKGRPRRNHGFQGGNVALSERNILAPSALEFTRGSLRCASSPLVGEDRGGGSRRPTRRASDGAFDNLLGPRDPPPIGRSGERPSLGRAMPAPT